MVHSWRYPFIVSDPDLLLPDSLPDDWLHTMFNTLIKYKYIAKSSLPLSLDSIDVANKEFILEHEISLVRNPLYRALTYLLIGCLDGLAICATDTTFSLYRPLRSFSTFSIRLPPSYSIKHLPWYSYYISRPEYCYYYSHKLSHFGHWSSASNNSLTL